MLSAVLGNSGMSFLEIVIMLLSSLFVIFFTMPIHEYAHALAAYKLGDTTAKYSGRLTLNPFAHIDWLGAILIIVAGFGFAKPVPVNQYNLRRPKRDMAIIGLAGPLANLIVAFVCTLLSTFIIVAASFSTSYTVWKLCSYLNLFFQHAGYINIVLASFNLIPLPPMDGSRILFSILPDKYYYKIQRYEQYIYYAVILLAITGALSVPTQFISNIFIKISNVIANLIFRLFGVI